MSRMKSSGHPEAQPRTSQALTNPESEPQKSEPQILTVGHSTRPIDEFIALLRGHEVSTLADIRTIPRSRRNPQYESSTLATAVETAGIRYLHVPALGGLRRPRRDSPNGAWRNESFRGYADYIQTDTFARALDDVQDLARHGRVALMCAEAVPWRCHRSLVADALSVRGVPVAHIVGAGIARPHQLSPVARIEDRRLTYPPTDA